MPYKDFDILVLLREVSDSRPPAHVTTRGAGISDRGLRRVPNPADLAALEEALCLKDRFGARVTALAIGPHRLDDILRLALSMGVDRSIRFHDHGLEGGDTVADARVLSRILAILSPCLVFTGSRLADQGDDPVTALAAATRDIACIGAAVSITLRAKEVEVQRKGDRGSRQTVTAPMPAMVLFEEVCTPRYPSIDAVTKALAKPVETWGLADLGLAFWAIGPVGSYLPVAEYGTPRPDPVRVVTPHPELPTFERIISLLSGGIKAREGRLHSGSADEAADRIWRILGEEGLVP
jgi:electron transfer flavoprotein beta subunit